VDGRLKDKELDDLLFSVAFILRYGLDGRLLPKALATPEPELAAERVLEQIERSGWRLVKLPLAPDHSAPLYGDGPV
jgi:hypothetical protein